MPFLTIETLPGETVLAGRNKITPFSQAFKITLPRSMGGLIWNRPVSVLVEGDDGSEEVLPVVDVTRIVQLVMLGFGLAGGFLFWLVKRRKT